MDLKQNFDFYYFRELVTHIVNTLKYPMADTASPVMCSLFRPSFHTHLDTQMENRQVKLMAILFQLSSVIQTLS